MNVLVISADGLTPGFMGCYGNEWIDTPAIDRLASEGIAFDRHFADQPDMIGARRAWRTGCFGFPTSESAPLREDVIALLGHNGVATTLITDGRLEPDDFVASWNHVAHAPSKGAGSLLKRVVARADSALEKLSKQERWLLWMDMGALLPPWNVPDDFQGMYFESEADDDREESEGDALELGSGPLPERVESDDDETYLRLQRTFAGAVCYLDAGIQAIIDALRNRGLLESTAIILTSGYGTALGEHGTVTQSLPALHEELVHVPLVVRLPDGFHAGRRVSGFTQSVDLAPTLCQLIGVVPPPCHGKSLIPLGECRSIAVTGSRNDSGTQWAIRTPDRACLFSDPAADADNPPLLFVKLDDRWEVNNVAQQFPEQADALVAELRGFVKQASRGGPENLP
jgi:hypothetical protein